LQSCEVREMDRFEGKYQGLRSVPDGLAWASAEDHPELYAPSPNLRWL
jgi:hypothetical protein